MKAMTYGESRAKLAQVLDSVVDDCKEVVIVRTGKAPVVIVSLAEYESLRGMDYLMRSPANAQHLSDSIAALEAGRGQRHDLIVP